MHRHNPLAMRNEVVWNEIPLFGFFKFEWNTFHLIPSFSLIFLHSQFGVYEME
jgi:hypothetical protein